MRFKELWIPRVIGSIQRHTLDFQKGFPLRCGYISAHFKEPDLVLIILKEASINFLGACPP